MRERERESERKIERKRERESERDGRGLVARDQRQFDDSETRTKSAKNNMCKTRSHACQTVFFFLTTALTVGINLIKTFGGLFCEDMFL